MNVCAPSRPGLIAKIHVARKKLALTDESYRDVLRRVTGKDSCSIMTDAQLEKALSEFKRLGFRGEKKAKRAGSRKMAQGNQARMIRGMWIELFELGEVKDPSEEALASYVARMVQIDDLHWITPDDANVVINGLRSWIRRVRNKHEG